MVEPSPESASAWRMPAEWLPHRRTWMAWPARAAAFFGTEGLEAGRRVVLAVAQAIAAVEPVTMIVRPEDEAAAGPALAAAGIEALPLPLDDGWTRDTGPTFLVDGQGGVAGTVWRFDAWGGLFPDHAEDARLAERILTRLDLPALAAPIICEGGAIATDGAGTLLTTEECLPSRNPHLSRTELEAALMAHTGTRQVVWLGAGYHGDETGGHIDEIAAFARPGLVLLQDCDDPADPNFAIAVDARRRLALARDAAGRALEVVPLPHPRRRDRDGRRQTLSYANFAFATGRIIMPAFDDPADATAARVMARVFPDREIVRIPALDLVRGGGGIHCITQPQPIAQGHGGARAGWG